VKHYGREIGVAKPDEDAGTCRKGRKRSCSPRYVTKAHF
jgi:hypothetical protein